MAIDITWKFSRITAPSDDRSMNRRLIYNIVYAQGGILVLSMNISKNLHSGVPVIITIITFLMDLYGSCDSVLPNMGRFTCFLGMEFDEEARFVDTPPFRYYYSIITIIMVLNMICFCITGYYLISHWVTVRNMQRK